GLAAADGDDGGIKAIGVETPALRTTVNMAAREDRMFVEKPQPGDGPQPGPRLTWLGEVLRAGSSPRSRSGTLLVLSSGVKRRKWAADREAQQVEGELFSCCS